MYSVDAKKPAWIFENVVLEIKAAMLLPWITGDVTQIDLPEGKKSGLTHAVHVLKDIEGIAICRLTDKDVVRHPLVMKIVRAYEQDVKRSESEKGEKQ